MSIPLHLFKTDIRRTWVPFLVWLLLTALHLVLMGASAHPGDRVMAMIFFSVSVAIPLFAFVVLVVLIPLVIQEEPLVGTTAFWFTRPIARGELLQAKLLFFAVLILLPLFAEIAVLAANGVSGPDIALAIPEILLTALVPILSLAVLAVLTPGFGRFAVVGAIVIVASMMVTIAITAVRGLLHPTVLLEMARTGTLFKSRTIVADLVAVVGGAAVLINQYLTRRTVRSGVTAGAVAVAMVLASNFWPLNFFPAPVIPMAAESRIKIDASGVKVAVERTYTQEMATIRGIGSPERIVTAQYQISGLPPGLFAVAHDADSHLTREDNTPISTTKSTWEYSSFGFGRPNIDGVEHALDGATVVNAGFPGINPVKLVTLEAAVYSQQSAEPLKLTADVPLTLYQYQIATELALARGSGYDVGSEHLIVTDVLHQGDGLEVVLERRRVNLLFSRSGGGTPISSLQDQEETIYVLYNKKRNQVVLPKRNVAPDLFSMMSPSVQRLARTTVRLEFGPEPMVLTPVMDNTWLADAKLVRLDRVPVAQLTRPVVIDHFRLNSENAQPTVVSPRRVGESASLAHLKLPENATRSQVKDYVETIMLNSQRRGMYTPTDPQVGMLVKVGAANLDVLIDEENHVPRGSLEMYLTIAINRLARPEDKPLILQALPTHRNLIESVMKYNWEVEAHDTLVAALKDERERSLPAAWIQAVASFEERETYPDLVAYLARCRNRQQTFNAIRKLPGIDLRAAVETAWRDAQHGNSFEELDGCAMAAYFGHADAIGALAAIMREDADETLVRRAATLFRRYTPAKGEPSELVAWYEANRDQLTFDEREKKFVPRSAAAAAK